MTIKSIFILSMLLLSLFSFSQPAIEGKWKSEENNILNIDMLLMVIVSLF